MSNRKVLTPKEVPVELLKSMYRQLYTIRIFETECIGLYRKGLIVGYFHPYLGEEAIAVGVCAALEDRDYITSTHRGHGHCIARGARVGEMTAELFGKETGYCRGRGGSMHIADIGMGNLGANGIVGAGTPIGTGAALGAKVRGDNNVTAVFTSDGGTNGGTFGECLNLAAIWDLAVIFVIENNHYAVSTPIEKMSRSDDLYKRALGYGVPGEKVDGNDVLAVYSAAKEAVERGRSGKGPTCIECDTYRHQGHHVNDPGTYMPQEKLDYYKQKDPVDRGRKYLTETAGEKAAEEIEESVRKEMEEAVEFAENSPEPDPEQFLKEVKNYE